MKNDNSLWPSRKTLCPRLGSVKQGLGVEQRTGIQSPYESFQIVRKQVKIRTLRNDGCGARQEVPVWTKEDGVRARRKALVNIASTERLHTWGYLR